MNKRISLTLAAISLLAASPAMADQKLVVTDSSSETTVASYQLSDISKLSFADGNLVVSLTGDKTEQVALTTSLVLKFDGGTSAISQVGGTDTDVHVAYDGNMLSATGVKGANAAVYTIGGQKAVALSSWDGSPVSTAALASGVYILKVNNKSFKFIKK